MQFQDAFPELTAKMQGPKVEGQPAPTRSPLAKLRRQQLHDLAIAYGVTVKKDGTKSEILPALQEAEGRGVFRGPVLFPYYLKKASRNADAPREVMDEPDPLLYEEKTKGPDLKEFRYEHLPDMSEMTIGDLRKLCVQHGIKSYGMKMNDMRQAIRARYQEHNPHIEGLEREVVKAERIDQGRVAENLQDER